MRSKTYTLGSAKEDGIIFYSKYLNIIYSATEDESGEILLAMLPNHSLFTGIDYNPQKRKFYYFFFLFLVSAVNWIIYMISNKLSIFIASTFCILIHWS